MQCPIVGGRESTEVPIFSHANCARMYQRHHGLMCPDEVDFCQAPKDDPLAGREW